MENYLLPAFLVTPPRVENIDIDVPGLKANGSITLLEADGGLNLARFDAVQVGEWIKRAR